MLRISDDFNEASLDDPSLRELANRDPDLLLSLFGPRLIIDEVQYAPLPVAPAFLTSTR